MSAQQNVLTKADKKRLRQLKMNKLIAEIQERWLPYSNRLEELYAFRCNREGVKYFLIVQTKQKVLEHLILMSNYVLYGKIELTNYVMIKFQCLIGWLKKKN